MNIIFLVLSFSFRLVWRNFYPRIGLIKAKLLCGFFMKSSQGYESLRGGFLGRALSV